MEYVRELLGWNGDRAIYFNLRLNVVLNPISRSVDITLTFRLSVSIRKFKEWEVWFGSTVRIVSFERPANSSLLTVIFI